MANNNIKAGKITLFTTNEGKSEEVNFKKDFCEKYFDKGTWSLDVLNQVDVLLEDRKGHYLLYIESKYKITNEAQRKRAIAQAILTNKKQEAILSRVAIIYQNEHNNEILEVIDCSEDSVMYNNDVNWSSEKPSNPTKDAVDRINDRVRGKIKRFRNDEIKEFYDNFKTNHETTINITEKNFNVVYNLWKNEVRFKESIDDEQDRINLFLVDLLNGTKYKKSVITDIIDHTLFDDVKIGEKEEDTEEPLIREGTNLSNYVMMKNGEVIDFVTTASYTVDDASAVYAVRAANGMGGLSAAVVANSNITITLPNVGYGTIYDSENTFVLPADLKAYVVSSANMSELTYTEVADYIPAGTAVMLEDVNKKGGEFNLYPASAKVTYKGANLLKGSDVATTTTAEENSLFYKLSFGPSSTELAKTFGWFYGAADGAAFQIEGHRAWLAIPKGSQSAPAFSYILDGEATGINVANSQQPMANSYYDLQGRKVANPTKGLYIVNGKTVIIK